MKVQAQEGFCLEPKSKWLPHISDPFPHVWASLHIYSLRDDASPRGKVVSPSSEKAAWAVAQFFLASSTSLPCMFLTRITWEWISHVVVRLLYHARVTPFHVSLCYKSLWDNQIRFQYLADIFEQSNVLVGQHLARKVLKKPLGKH